MNKFIPALSAVLFFMFVFTRVSAQDILKEGEIKATKRDTKTYNLVSIDGKNQKVTIIPDYEKHVLKITSLKETISIQDFWGVPPESRLLNKNFIRINYAVRGGSGVGLGNTMIICINGSHLYQAMHVLRYLTGESGGIQEEYRIKMHMVGNHVNNYKLKVSVHDFVDSKPFPKENYVYDNNTILAFDVHQNVFYSVKQGLYDQFITTKNKAKQKVNGNFPVILLGKDTYYFINGKWYFNRLDKEMIEFQ